MSLRCPLSFLETKASLHRANGQTEMTRSLLVLLRSNMCLVRDSGGQRGTWPDYTDQVVSDPIYQFSRTRVTIRATLSVGSPTRRSKKVNHKILERKDTYVAMQLVTDVMRVSKSP